MKFYTVLLFAIALGVVFASVEERPDDFVQESGIAKRGAIQFYALIRRYTDRDPKDFWGYGCWCGLGGKGRPRDGIDRCCQSHDWCFNRLVRRRICRKDQPYHKNYYYNGLKCYTGWWSSRCGIGICRCDMAAVKCFMRNGFNNRFKNYNKNTC